MAHLRALAFGLCMAATFVFLVPLQWLARRLKWRVQDRIQTTFCRMMCTIIGIRVDARGVLQGAAPRFAVGNHVSWTDIIALSAVHPFVFLAKSEVARWPVLGALARLQGTIFVERANRRAIPLVNAALADRMRAGLDVVVFAEGTSSDGSSVLKFNSSHFALLCDLAKADEAPHPTLAPLAISYADRAGKLVDAGWYGDMTFLPHLWALMKRGDLTCRISFGAAVPVGGDRKALAAETEARVRDLLAAQTGRGA